MAHQLPKAITMVAVIVRVFVVIVIFFVCVLLLFLYACSL